MSSLAEKQRLENIAAQSHYGHGVNANSAAYAFRVLKRYLRAGPILELGPAEGHMTELLVELEQPLTCVDAGRPFCEAIRARYPQVEVVHSLFEEYLPKKKFGSVVLGHVLEHVEDPIAILSAVRTWLSPGGRVLASVPNARSLHRQAAVIMGLLPFEETLNEADHMLGHRRVYTPESFRRDFLAAHLSVEVFGGYWMKPLSNAQIEASFTPEMLEAFMMLGERYPDIAGEIYVIAENG